MRIHIMPLVVGIGSLIWITMATHRWWFKYNDPSQLILGLLIGGGGLLFSYLWNWMKKKDDEDRKQTKRINAIVDFWMNRQKDAIEEIARGGNGDE